MKKLSLSAAFFMIAAMVPQAKAAGPDVGKIAPAFTLTDTNGKPHSLADFKGKYVVLEWTNYSCPFVVKHYESGNMQGLQNEWTKKGVVWLSVSSSAKGKEGNLSAADWNKAIAEQKAAPTALLLDENGKVGRLYGAKTTPHMYIIDPSGLLIYKGAIDDKASFKKEDIPTSKNYVTAALTEAMDGKKVTTPSTESYGCSVKYK